MAEPRPTFTRDLTWRLEALAFDLASAIARLFPVEQVSAAGGWLFRRLGRFTRPGKIARRNIEIAFPDWSADDRDRLLDAQWDNLGRTFFEFPLTDRLTPAGGRVEVVGRERLVAIAQSGAPAILISGHFANWEVMAAAIIDAGVPCRVTYRAANNPYVDKRIRDARARYGVKLFAPKGGAGSRELLVTLKDGQSVTFMNDQKFNGGIAAPFFGRTVHTAGAPTRVALQFGALLQPMRVQRLPDARFRVIVDPPIPLQDTGDRKADVEAGVAAINDYIEACIRDRPAEWFWVHRRWPQEAYAAL